MSRAGAFVLRDWRAPLFVLVAGLHAGGLAWLSRGTERFVLAPEFAIEVTLAAPATPEMEPSSDIAPASEVPPSGEPDRQEVAESAPEPAPEPDPEPVPEPPAEAEQVVTAAIPPSAPALEPQPVPTPVPKQPVARPERRPAPRAEPKPVEKPARRPVRETAERPRGEAARPAARAAASAPASAAATANYGAAVMAAIRSRVSFPPEARDRVGGLVRVSFVIGPGGRVESASVAGSSGVPALDRAALAAVRGISAPPPPNGRFAATAPIRFNLQ